MKNYISIILLSFVFTAAAYGQSLQTSNLYLSNLFSLHAAYAGTTEGVSVNLQGWNKWNNFGDRAPVGGLLSVHTALEGKIGIGGRILSDRRGIFNALLADVAASYTVDFSNGKSLRLGLNAGLIQSKINRGASANAFVNMEDPTLNVYQETNLQIGAGAALIWKSFELAFSVPNLLRQGNQFYNRPLLLTALYKAEIGSNWGVTPFLAYQQTKNNPALFDLGMRVRWQEKIWGQLGYRNNKSILFGGGVSLSNVRLGYIYEAAAGGLAKATSGSHEVLLGITFGKKNTPAAAE